MAHWSPSYTKEDTERVRKAYNDLYTEEEKKKVQSDAQSQLSSITKRLNSGAFMTAAERVQLQKDIYSYESNLAKLSSFGFDVKSAQKQLSDIQKTKDSQSKFYSQFKDENEYFDWSMRDKYKSKSVSDIDTILNSQTPPRDASEKREYEWLNTNRDSFMTTDEIQKEIDDLEKKSENQRSSRNKSFFSVAGDVLGRIAGSASGGVSMGSSGASGQYEADSAELNETNARLRKLKTMLAERSDFDAAGAYQNLDDRTHFWNVFDDDYTVSDYINDRESKRIYGNKAAEQSISKATSEIENNKELQSDLAKYQHYITNASMASDLAGSVNDGGTLGIGGLFNIVRNAHSDTGLGSPEAQAIVKKWTDKGYDFSSLWDAYQRKINAEITKSTEEKAKEFASSHPHLADFSASFVNTVGGIAALPELAYGAEKNANSDIPYKIDLNSAGFQPSNYNDELSEERTQAVQQKYTDFYKENLLNTKIGKWVDDLSGGKSAENFGESATLLYHSGMSILDNITKTTLFGFNTNAVRLAMGLSSGVSGIKRAIEKNGTSEEALVTGVLYAIAEALFEKVSIETLFRSVGTNSVKNYVYNIAKSFVSEGSEELATDIANTISDALVNVNNTDFVNSIYGYMNEGKSASEAKALALGDTMLSMGQSFMGGALAGGLTAGGLGAVSLARANHQYSQIGNEVMKEGGTDTLMQIANDQAPDNVNIHYDLSAIEKQQKKAYNKELKTQQKTALNDAVKNRLSEIGISDKEIDAAANSVVKAFLNGDDNIDLTASEKSKNAAYRVFRELISTETDSGKNNYSNEWAVKAQQDISDKATEKAKSKYKASDIGRLYSDVQEQSAEKVSSAYSDEMKKSVQSRIEELGMDKSTSRRGAEIVMKAISGEKMTASEHSLLEKNAVLSRTYLELFTSDTDFGRENYTNKWATDASVNAAMAYASAVGNTYDARMDPIRTAAQAKEAAAQMSAKEREKNAAVIDGKSETAVVVDIVGKTDDGVTVRLDNGSVAIVPTKTNVKGNTQTVTLQDKQTAHMIRLASDYRTPMTMKAFINGIEEGQDTLSYTKDFNSAYMQGLQGKKMNTAGFTISDDQARAAYTAGRGDRNAKLSDTSGNAAVDGMDFIGVVQKNSYKSGVTRLDSKSNLSYSERKQLEILDAYGKKHNLSFLIVDTLRTNQGSANGLAAGGNKIMIALDAEQGAILSVAGHEVFHYLKAQNPTDAKILQDFVIDTLKKSKKYNYQQRFNELAIWYETDNEDAINEEIAANAMFDVLADEKTVQSLYEENKSLFEKVRDAIEKFFAEIKKIIRDLGKKWDEVEALREDQKTLETISAMFDSVMWKTEQNNKNTATQDGDYRKLSLKKMGLDDFDKQTLNNIKMRKGIIINSVDELEDNIEIALKGKKKINMYFGAISDSVKNRIESDIHQKIFKEKQYSFIISYDDIIHISSHFGMNSSKIAGEVMRIYDIIKSYDSVKLEVTPKGTRNLIFEKSYSDYDYRCVDIVSNNNSSLDLVTLFVTKNNIKKRSQSVPPANNIGSQRGSASNNSISQNAPVVNTQSMQQGEKNSQETKKSLKSRDDEYIDDNPDLTFSLKSPVEETKTLVALHNFDERKIRDTLKLGAFPSPSIAIVKAKDGHSKYGEYSAVFYKDTIDPQADRRNKVYGSDAWTPTSSDALVEYEVDYEKKRAIESNIESLSSSIAGGTFRRGSILSAIGIDDVTSKNIDDIAESLSHQDTVRAAYLSEKGGSLEPEYMAKVYNRYGNEALQTYIDRIGPQKLASIIVEMETSDDSMAPVRNEEETIRKIIRDKYEKDHAVFLNKKPDTKEQRLDKYMQNNVSIFTVEDFIKAAWDYYENGETVSSEIDRVATSDKLRDSVNDKDVAIWIKGKLNGLIGESGIYNGSDPYYASGIRKSFSETHYPYTAENIVRAMQNTASERGQGYFGAGAEGMVAMATPEYKSIDDIHADENRLSVEDENEHRSRLDAIDSQIESIIEQVQQMNESHSDNPYEERDIIGSILMDTAAKSKHDAESIRKAFAKEGYTLSKALSEYVAFMYNSAAQIPTGYFEAKPQRVVSFNEVAAVIAPDNAPSDLVQNFRNAGMNVVTYEAGNEQSRLDALNGIDNVRFSLKERQDVIDAHEKLLRENDKLREANKILQEELSRTDGHTFGTKARNNSRTIAARLIREYKSTADDADIQKKIESVFEYLARNGDVKGATESLIQIGEEVIEQSRLEDSELKSPQLKELKKEMRESKLRLNEDTMEKVADAYGSYEKFRKAMFGRIRLVSDPSVMSLDEKWDDIVGRYGEIFTAEDMELYDTEQIDRLVDVLNTPTYYMVDGMRSADITEAAASFAYNAIGQFMEFVGPTFADKQAYKLEKTVDKYKNVLKQARAKQREIIRVKNEKLAETKRYYREKQSDIIHRKNEKIDETKQYYRDMMDRQRDKRNDTQNRAKMRKHIIKKVNDLASMLTLPTDKKHIPEGLRSLVTEYLQLFTGDSAVMDEARIARVQNAYNRLMSEDDSAGVSQFIDEDIAAGFQELATIARDITDGRRLSELNAEETKTIEDITDHLAKLVKDVNTFFIEGKRQDRTELATSIMRELDETGYKVKKGMFSVMWNEITPYYFFKQASPTLHKVWGDVLDGQSRYGLRMDEARERVLAMKEKHNVSEWEDDTKKLLTITTEKGEELSFTVNQALGIYAVAKREAASDKNAQHLTMGGVVFREKTSLKDKVETKLGKQQETNADAHQLSAADVAALQKQLTSEQIAFADDMIAYLSSDVAAWGNETSMSMYGYQKFTEKSYYPFHTSDYFKKTEADGNKNEATAAIKNKSMTKATVQNAKSPVVVENFTEVCAKHISEMIVYSTLAEPQNNLVSLFNYKTIGTDTAAAVSMKTSLANALGNKANQYFVQIIKDMNQGARMEASTKTIMKMLGKFKKNAVAANLSVIVQQPTAIGRAMALVDPKYFLTTAKKNGYEELKKYSGVAVIKEMGRFDVDTGISDAEWLGKMKPVDIKEKAKAFLKDGSYRDDVFGWAAGKADEVTWNLIWQAVKKEVQAKQGLSGEKLLVAAGKRFNDVIEATQVYDSVLTRSQIMRSRDTGVRMATSFMAEPIKTINLLYDAVYQAQGNHNKESMKYLSRAVGGVLVASLLNALSKSFVTAGRDDDENQAFWEKYIEALVKNSLSEISVLEKLPFVKDIISLIQGYDISRTDMDMVGELISSVQKVSKLFDDNFYMQTESEQKKAIKDAIKNLIGTAGAFVGLPAKNIIRDVGAIVRSFKSINDGVDTTKQGAGYSAVDALIESFDNRFYNPFEKMRVDEEDIYKAMVDGDEDKISEKWSEYESYLIYLGKNEEKAYKQVRSAVKEKVKLSVLKGDLSDEDAERYLISYLDDPNGYWTVKEWHFSVDDANEGLNFSKYDRLKADVLAGNDISEAVKELTDHNTKESTVRTKVTSIIEDAYEKDEITIDRAEELLRRYMGFAEKQSMSRNPIDEEKDVLRLADKWEGNKGLPDGEYYTAYDALDTAILDGTSAESAIEKLYDLQYTDSDIKTHITATIRDAYINGEMNASLAKSKLTKYTDYSSEEASDKIKIWDFKEKNPDSDFADATILKYLEVADDGISLDVYADYYERQKECTGTKDENGKTISGSKKAEIMKVIDSLPITSKQKDALYYQNGWSQSKIYQAPWH